MRERYFEATEFENIREIVYNSAEKYAENRAFILKRKEGKNIQYENITYKRLLEEINNLGTKFFNLGYKNKRIAIVGRNSYGWALTHLTNMLRWNCVSSIRQRATNRRTGKFIKKK